MLWKLAALSVLVCPLFGQHSVSPENFGHKVYAVVPLAGSGKQGDARRPVLVPSQAELDAVAQANRGAVSPTVPDLLGYVFDRLKEFFL